MRNLWKKHTQVQAKVQKCISQDPFTTVSHVVRNASTIFAVNEPVSFVSFRSPYMH